ncbi:MAG: hypothetical protein K2H53_05420 [Clostridia bacterium]|nr:hypothetical protein [Clostridia bacterium]
MPIKVQELSDIRYVSGGDKYSLAIDKNYKVYEAGTNKYGELGNGTNLDVTNFTELNTIDDVLGISGGNTYTVLVKNDGTVWGMGDYAHGDEEIKSKTRGSIPTQVGNDDTGIDETEITVTVRTN